MPTPNLDIAQLAGSWRLLSHVTTFTDTEERRPNGRCA